MTPEVVKNQVQPQRIIREKHVAMFSAHIVDDGPTVPMQGLKVVPAERGKGGSSPTPPLELEADNPSAILKDCCTIDGASLISLRFPLKIVPTLISEAISKMKKSGDEYYELISLQPDDLRSILLNRTRADRKGNTRVVSLGTAPYRDPMGSYVFRINMFGKDLSALKSVFLSQLQSLPPLQGNVICLLSVNPLLLLQLWEFCTKDVGLEKGKQCWKDLYIIEGDIYHIMARL
ncbi:probable N-acetyltransferase 16 [Carcharodon carcharias]|uniref:probable N-acetyltransferase 16 n=1 Tax=Carcharodon carcharias TaxID=13397 RepID=UPI001B7F3E76|nr:probable N-acetyltransferase 16 [Carcharodon carcharias]